MLGGGECGTREAVGISSIQSLHSDGRGPEIDMLRRRGVMR